jgi:hypothetical protein
MEFYDFPKKNGNGIIIPTDEQKYFSEMVHLWMNCDESLQKW